MKARPNIELKLSTTDVIIEIIGWLAVVGIWILTFIHYEKLPEQIPIHYNSTGKADGFGDKNQLLILPIVATLFFIGLTLLNKFPRIFNYFIPLAQENAFFQYSAATRLIRFVKLLFVIIFGLVVFMTIQTAKGTAGGLGIWFLPLMIGLFFILIMYLFEKGKKALISQSKF